MKIMVKKNSGLPVGLDLRTKCKNENYGEEKDGPPVGLVHKYGAGRGSLAPGSC